MNKTKSTKPVKSTSKTAFEKAAAAEKKSKSTGIKVTVSLEFKTLGLNSVTQEILTQEILEGMIVGKDVEIKLANGKILDTISYVGSAITRIAKIVPRKEGSKETADETVDVAE